MDWNTQLHRMVSLCHMEAAEYERGRNLQVLQPSLASLLHVGPLQQRPTVAVTAQPPGRPTSPVDAVPTPMTSGSGTPCKQQVVPQLAGQSTKLGPSGSCSSTHRVPERTTSINSIKQEDTAAGTQQATVAAAAAAATQAAPHKAAHVMPTPLPGTPLAATTNVHTPVSSSSLPKAGDAVLAMPATTSPAGRSLAGGVSNQQMALACNSVIRLPSHRADVPAATPQQQQFQLPCPAGNSVPTTTPMLVQQVDSTPLMQQVLMQPAKQQQPPASAQQDRPLDSSQTNWNRKGKRAGYNIEPEALKRLVQKQLEVQRERQQSQQNQQQQTETNDSEQQQQAAAAPQRLQQQQQHRQRCFTRVPQQFQQQDQDSAAAAVLESPGTAASDLPLQLQGDGLASPDACMGLNMPSCSELEQPVPAVQLELDASKIFGSAQKKLRLSICDEGQGLLPQTDLQLSLTSPVAFPSGPVGMGKVNRLMPTAVQQMANGAAAAAGGGSIAIASSAADPAPPLELATPSKFFAGSPVVVSAAAAGGDAAAATAAAEMPSPAFATPSKFFSGSPVAAAARKPTGQSTPETPLLFGHGSASPWPHKLDMQQQELAQQLQQQQTVLASSCPLFKKASLGMGPGSGSDATAQQQPSSWVPVDSNRLSLLAATPDPAALAATPAGAAVKVFCTPIATAADADIMDAAAAAAAPVETLPIKPSGALPAETGKAASAAATDADAANAAAAVTAAGNGAAAGSASLMTPPGQEQQVQATPVTAM